MSNSSSFINLFESTAVSVSTSWTYVSGVIDALRSDQLIYEVRWSLSAAPDQGIFAMMRGTNDDANFNNVTDLPLTWSAGNVATTGPTYAQFVPNANGKAILGYAQFPRYAQLILQLAGNATPFSGTVTIHVIGRDR